VMGMGTKKHTAEAEATAVVRVPQRYCTFGMDRILQEKRGKGHKFIPKIYECETASVLGGHMRR
jgi:hypothetical protein